MDTPPLNLLHRISFHRLHRKAMVQTTVERLFELHEPYTHVETSGDVQ